MSCYIFYYNIRINHELQIEEIKANNKNVARNQFIKKHGYDNNEAYDFQNIIIKDIKNEEEYLSYQWEIKQQTIKVENEKIYNKNYQKWINKMQLLIDCHINKFYIPCNEYSAFSRTLENSQFVGKVTCRRSNKVYLILNEEEELKKLL